jgi:hypothetical protein
MFMLHIEQTLEENLTDTYALVYCQIVHVYNNYFLFYRTFKKLKLVTQQCCVQKYLFFLSTIVIWQSNILVINQSWFSCINFTNQFFSHYIFITWTSCCWLRLVQLVLRLEKMNEIEAIMLSYFYEFNYKRIPNTMPGTYKVLQR